MTEQLPDDREHALLEASEIRVMFWGDGDGPPWEVLVGADGRPLDLVTVPGFGVEVWVRWSAGFRKGTIKEVRRVQIRPGEIKWRCYRPGTHRLLDHARRQAQGTWHPEPVA